MRKIISFMHVSLDGFVAGPQGEMDWITINETIFDHVGQRISQTDTAMYGRITYDMMENYWPTAADKPNASKHDIEHSQWYSKAHKIVLSKTLNEAQLNNSTIISDNIAENINNIKNQSGSEILLFGSPTATHALLQENLIDGYWLFVNPILLGQGIPLFANIKEKTKLKLVNTKAFDCGVTELNYILDKA
ncbi:dihydrofolate reductase family protein [Flavobacterium flavipallidum]|uniref:Dihydrofolate reductase family protein n=1 Tax=Flavobacterium flavipallidum TaxID=3139140 RepID=A0ABU9HN78_9FLAO